VSIFFKYIFTLLASSTLVLTTPAVWAGNSTLNPNPTAADTKGFNYFPIGVNIGKRNALSSIQVWGKEDGKSAVNFDAWHIPYDSIIQALNITSKKLPDGKLELHSSFSIVTIDPEKLGSDPKLGQFFTPKDLQTIFGIKVEFDINEYALVLNVPEVKDDQDEIIQQSSLNFSGLPTIAAPNFAFSALQQSFSGSAGGNQPLNFSGEMTGYGTIFGGSFYFDIAQSKIENLGQWNFATIQYLKQSPQIDYIIGAQSVFWPSFYQQNNQTISGNYWGFTLIDRFGFTPQSPSTLGGGAIDVRSRLQSNQIGQTVSGQTTPGTLVRLVRGFNNHVVAEVLVDSSGSYYFDNVIVGNDSIGNDYRLLLYPKGQLSAVPEIRQMSFTLVAGQIPTGASALVVSAGMNRLSGNNNQNTLENFNFSNFRGGIYGRWGLADNLTIGAGGIYDGKIGGFGEIFYQPKIIPLTVAATVITGSRFILNSNIQFTPFNNFSASFTSNENSSHLQANWHPFSFFNLAGTYDSYNGAGVTGQFNMGSTSASLSISSNSSLSWSLSEYFANISITVQGNDVGIQSEIVYDISRIAPNDSGISLILDYNSNNQPPTKEDLLTLRARYRSQALSINNNHVWDIELGYGMGTYGSGIIAAIGTDIIPGCSLQIRYQNISLSSNQSSVSINLVSDLNLQNGIHPSDRNVDYFRTSGGLLIQPFYDREHSGNYNSSEELYTDINLIRINNKELFPSQATITSNGILVRLPPGTYRIDLDPSGYPLDWKAKVEALAVNVVAGTYTPVQVPLVQSYTISGIVTDAKGKPINGAKVEAIPTNPNSQRIFSITNEAGVYFLEGLEQDKYNVQISGQSANPLSITIDKSSKTFQELNFKLIPN